MHNYITAERLLWRGSAKIPKSGQLRPASRSATVGGVTERQDNLLISFSSAGQPAVRDRDSDSRLSARAGKISHVIADCATTGPTAEVARQAGTRCHPRDAPAVRCSQGPDDGLSSVGETSTRRLAKRSQQDTTAQSGRWIHVYLREGKFRLGLRTPERIPNDEIRHRRSGAKLPHS